MSKVGYNQQKLHLTNEYTELVGVVLIIVLLLFNR